MTSFGNTFYQADDIMLYYTSLMLSICYDYITLETDNVLGLRVITEFNGILE